MYQPYPSSGQPVEPLRPSAPTPVRTAVRLMCTGAAVSTAPLIIALAFIGDIKAYRPPTACDGMATASPQPGSVTCARALHRGGHGSTGQINHCGQ